MADPIKRKNACRNNERDFVSELKEDFSFIVSFHIINDLNVE